MHIFAISGSLRASSTTTTLLRAIVALAPTNVEIGIYDGLDDLPHFSPDRDGDDAPTSVRTLREQLRAADGVLICTPEYAYGMPGSLKNALDWTVSSGEFSFKPTAAVSASPHAAGGERALASLLLTLRAEGARVAEGATLSVPFVRKKMDEAGAIVDPETKQAVRGVLDAFARDIQGQ